MRVKSRIPEGGAIKDDNQMTMEQYSNYMKTRLWKQYTEFADSIISRVNPLNNAKVLEIGPGPGWGGIALLEKRQDLQLEGLEPSRDMIRVASANAKEAGMADRISYFEGFAENMAAIGDCQYDLVISRESLHHWTDPEKAFREVKRVLKKDGKVCIYDHRRDLGLFGKIIVAVYGSYGVKEMMSHWKASIRASYTAEEIGEILESAGCGGWKIEKELMNLVIFKP